MLYTIKLLELRTGKIRRVVDCETRQKLPAALSCARSLAKRHKPDCHQNFGLNLAAVYDEQGRLIGGFKIWRDGEIRELNLNGKRDE